MINIIVPMAGKGQRFLDAGYKEPKPFIELLNGKTMLECVIENIKPHNIDHSIYLACRSEHLSYFNKYPSILKHNISLIPILEDTNGQASTIEIALEFCDLHSPLIIANSDQLVVYNKTKWYDLVQNQINYIMCFENSHPKWSYVEEMDGEVYRTAEKEVISDKATVGIYSYKDTRTAKAAIKQMKRVNLKVNGEFYLCPSYNFVNNTKVFKVDEMIALGTPEDMEVNKNRVKELYESYILG